MLWKTVLALVVIFILVVFSLVHLKNSLGNFMFLFIYYGKLMVWSLMLMWMFEGSMGLGCFLFVVVVMEMMVFVLCVVMSKWKG